VITELFAFCADDVVAMSKEVTTRIAINNSENATRDKQIDFRIGSILLVYCFLVRFFRTGRLAGAEDVACSSFFGVDFVRMKSAITFTGTSASQTISLSFALIRSDCSIVCASLSGMALIPCCINPESRLLMIFAVSELSAFIAPRNV